MAILALTYVGALAFAVPIILLFSHGDTAAVRYVNYAGIVLLCLGFSLMGLRGRRRTAALWGIRTDGLLFRAGYAVYVGAALTTAFGLLLVNRNSFDLAMVGADGQRFVLPADSIEKGWITLALMLVWFALVALDYVYLRYLRDQSSAGNR